jgi:excisionase family DNA binding protein
MQTLEEINVEEKLIFTVTEAAALLNCHRETIKRAIRSGALKAGKIGRDYRISRGDLEDYFRQGGGGNLFADSTSPAP